MSTILLFDVGNTHTSLGACDGSRLLATWRITTRTDATPDEYAVLVRNLIRQQGTAIGPFEGGAIASSVPPMVPTLVELCERLLHFTPQVVGPELDTGMPIRTDDPGEVGGDRIANALAAREAYGAPVIVIDFSTATIFDAVSAAGEYLGATISPGLGVSADALFRTTAQLARVELAPPPGGSAIGRNSIASVQAGLIYGYVGMVEGLIERLKRELGGAARVVATGELVGLIASHTPAIQVVDENLTLQGLRLIYERTRTRA